MNNQPSAIKVVCAVVAVAAALFLHAGDASAITSTWDFGLANAGLVGGVGGSVAFTGTQLTAGNITAKAYAVDASGTAGSYNGAIAGVYQRNVGTDDKGLGACLGLACSVSAGSAGARQEINNEDFNGGTNQKTLIRLDLTGLAAGWTINKVSLSSLDDSFTAEFVIFGSTLANANPTLGSANGPQLATGGSNTLSCTTIGGTESGANCNDINITQGSNKYLYFTVPASQGVNGNESYLVHSVAGTCTSNCTVNQVPGVPEPSTWILLGSGLAGLAYWRRKQAASA